MYKKRALSYVLALLILFSTMIPATHANANQEGVVGFVERLYKLTLGREAEEDGLNYWTGQLISGQKTGAEVSENFIFSREFVEKDISPSNFLDIMYRAFFNREPDEGGKIYWLGKMDEGYSRKYILAQFVNSKEFLGICNTYGIETGSIKLGKDDIELINEEIEYISSQNDITFEESQESEQEEPIINEPEGKEQIVDESQQPQQEHEDQRPASRHGDMRFAGVFNSSKLVTLKPDASYKYNLGQLNNMIFKTYGYRYMPALSNDGMHWGMAEFLHDIETNRYGLKIMSWRKSYDSDIALNCALNSVLETFYFFTGDKEVAFALWDWFDAKNINGYADTDDFGFTTIEEFDNGAIVEMNGIKIKITSENKVNTLYFE